MVVDSLNFNVNTVEKVKVAQMDRFKNIREDDVKKIGLRHNKKRIGEMVERQVFATKSVSDPPVSMLKEEEYFLKDYRPPFKVWDPIKSISGKEMDTNIHPDYRQRQATSKHVTIQSMKAEETKGPKWGVSA